MPCTIAQNEPAGSLFDRPLFEGEEGENQQAHPRLPDHLAHDEFQRTEGEPEKDCAIDDRTGHPAEKDGEHEAVLAQRGVARKVRQLSQASMDAKMSAGAANMADRMPPMAMAARAAFAPPIS